MIGTTVTPFAHMVADDRLTDLRTWTDENLATILLERADADLELPLEATGFSVAEIDLMLKLEDGSDGALSN